MIPTLVKIHIPDELDFSELQLAHRANGGAMDAVAEDLIAEVLAENEHGSALSYPPGRA